MKYIVRDIERAVCQRFDLTTEQIRSKCRKRYIARPRQIACFLSRELTSASYPALGRHFGGRDHTTILHAKRKIDSLLRESNMIPGYVQDVRDILAGMTPDRARIAGAVANGLHNPAYAAGRQ